MNRTVNWADRHKEECQWIALTTTHIPCYNKDSGMPVKVVNSLPYSWSKMAAQLRQTNLDILCWWELNT